MTRNEVVQAIWTMSSGTVAAIIGNAKYRAIDTAVNKAVLYAAKIIPDYPEEQPITLEYLHDIILDAQRCENI